MCPGLIPRLGMLWIESMAVFFHLSSQREAMHQTQSFKDENLNVS